MAIVITIDSKEKEKKYKCCVCWKTFDIVDFSYVHKHYVENYHICKDCALNEGIRKTINEMVDYYKADLKRKPGLRYRIGAFFKKDSFSYVITRAWIEAHKKIKKEIIVANAMARRDQFIASG